MAIDFGPVMIYLLIVLIVIPALVGLSAGMFVAFLLTRKKKSPKTTRITSILLVGILFAVLFPIAAIKFNELQTHHENNKFIAEEKQYIAQSLRDFQIEKIFYNDDKYQLTLRVPRTGKYRMIVNLFQNNKQVSLLANWVEGLNLVAGVNILNIDLNGKDITPLPADFIIMIQNKDDTFALRNTRKSLVVLNASGIEKKEGVIYYSVGIETSNGKCPVFNYSDWLPCVTSGVLHIE